MWVNMTIARMSASYEAEGLPLLYSPHNMQVMTSAKGFISGYALFRGGDRTLGCSLSIWESQADAEAFFASPEYAAMVSSVRQYILQKPDRQGWEVKLDMKEVALGVV